MKFISWNVDGLFSALDKGLLDFAKEEQADFYCFQEIRTSKQKVENQLFNFVDDYKDYWLFAKKKGYSGVAIFTKKEPLSVQKGIGRQKFDQEGRVLTLEYPNFYLVNTYFPHSGRDLKRLDFKLEFNQLWSEFVNDLHQQKPVVLTGDFNVAHTEKDLTNSQANKNNAGFTKQEREWFDSFLHQGYIDTFRELHSDQEKYSWWTYRYNARERNIGWRIDYFLISQDLKSNLEHASILNEVYGSDHCPIRLELGLDK